MNNVNRVNAPAFTGAIVIARHAPAESCDSETGWKIDNRGDKALRIATPSLTTSNRTASITADCAVITTHDEAAANGKNVLKCISTVSAHLQHASIESNIWVHFRSFEIEILVKRQLTRSDRKLYGVEPLIAYDRWIINQCGVRRRIGRWRWHAAIGCDPKRRRSQHICC